MASGKETNEKNYSSATTKETDKEPANTIKSQAKKGKSNAKRMGIKSTLIVNDKAVITSWLAKDNSSVKTTGKANIDSVVEIPCSTITTKGHYDLSLNNLPDRIGASAKIKIGNETTTLDTMLEALTTKETPENVRNDLVGIKAAVEKEIFGKEYTKDNLHIQIAYNILDIKKILSAYVNNIICSLYNLQRNQTGEKLTTDTGKKMNSDLIGTMCMNKANPNNSTYNIFCRLIRPYYFLVDNVFQDYARENEKNARKYNPLKKEQTNELLNGIFGNGEDSEKTIKDKYNYYTLLALSYLRQFCAHSSVQLFELGSLNYEDVKNNVATVSKYSCPKEVLGIFEDVYSKRVSGIETDFIKNSTVNMSILFDLYYANSRESKCELAKDYFDYVVKRDDHNLGISVKKLREIIFSEENLGSVAKKNEDDITRNKKYSLASFVLYRYLRKNADDIIENGMRIELLNSTTEQNKNDVYKRYAKALLGRRDLKDSLLNLKNKFQSTNVFRSGTDMSDFTEKCSLGNDSVDFFSKAILFLTCFLSKKEINELLSSFINKFDNIRDLVSIGEHMKCEMTFAEGYEMFANSGVITNQLRMMKNIGGQKARADKQNPKTATSPRTGTLIDDALALLGCQKYEIDDEGRRKKDADKNVITKQYQEIYDFLYGTLSQFSARSNNGSKVYDHKMRNFLINNITNSRRFYYVISHINPYKAREVTQNLDLVKMVLKNLPASQIDRYYESVIESERSYEFKTRIEQLAEKIKGVSYKDLYQKYKNNYSKMDKNRYREDTSRVRLGSLINLYLTVIYVFYKNMVKINARYFIAYSALERDYWYKNGKALDESSDKEEAIKSLASGYASSTIESFQELYDNHKKDKEDKRFYVRQHHRKTYHHAKCLMTCLQQPEQESLRLCTTTRNNIMHMTFIGRIDEVLTECNLKNIKIPSYSYFSVYHYCVQSLLSIVMRITDDSFVAKAVRLNEANHTYSKDLLHCMFVPFGYNSARYHNLTMEKLFNEYYKSEETTKDVGKRKQ